MQSILKRHPKPGREPNINKKPYTWCPMNHILDLLNPIRSTTSHYTCRNTTCNIISYFRVHCLECFSLLNFRTSPLQMFLIPNFWNSCPIQQHTAKSTWLSLLYTILGPSLNCPNTSTHSLHYMRIKVKF
jgi:hypothetical protein